MKTLPLSYRLRIGAIIVISAYLLPAIIGGVDSGPVIAGFILILFAAFAPFDEI